MEELSRRGSRRPSGGADEREEKVAAEGVVQKGGCGRDRWKGKKNRKTRGGFLKGGGDNIVEEQRNFSESFEGKSIG